MAKRAKALKDPRAKKANIQGPTGSKEKKRDQGQKDQELKIPMAKRAKGLKDPRAKKANVQGPTRLKGTRAN